MTSPQRFVHLGNGSRCPQSPLWTDPFPWSSLCETRSSRCHHLQTIGRIGLSAACSAQNVYNHSQLTGFMLDVVLGATFWCHLAEIQLLARHRLLLDNDTKPLHLRILTQLKRSTDGHSEKQCRTWRKVPPCTLTPSEILFQIKKKITDIFTCCSWVACSENWLLIQRKKWSWITSILFPGSDVQF